MNRMRWIATTVFCCTSCFSPEDKQGASGEDPTSSTSGTTSPSSTSVTDPSGPSGPSSATDPSDASDPSGPTDPATTASGSETADPDTSASETSSTAAPTTTDDGSSGTEDSGPVDAEPPTLSFGAFIDSTHISLTFSEPIDTVDGVNPAKFRPSEGWWDSDDCHQVYLDLLNDFPDDNCPCVTVVGLENDPGDAFTIIAELSNPTNADTCNNAGLSYLPVMHYDADTLATAQHIRDLAGNPLGEFGGQFVESPGLSSLVINAASPYPDFPGGEVLLEYSAICG
ncbi:MAG: hypothetical protein IAG13_23050 [Deltaproteobacteria bacterium]|nr:hypothetical protein [Nannocystaceae bacterium]